LFSRPSFADRPLPCPSYQSKVPFAAAIKKAYPNLPIGAVGLLTTAPQIEKVLRSGQADVAFLARELLRNIDFTIEAAEELGVVVKAPVQYERAWTRMQAGKNAPGQEEPKQSEHEGSKDPLVGRR
jgi:2,4-dienoyl-CoA reductase-like NADH-dependent reductase (Old Yellow Enzyme family)